MKTKYSLNRKKIRAALPSVFFMGLAACVFAANPADPRLELRQRLDSVEVETQVRKRQGKPIEDLEAASAELRDTLLNMRGDAPRTAPPSREAAEWGGALFGGVPFLEDIASWRPSGAFDWVIVGTGAVALLSGLALVIGLFAGGKKKRAAAPRKQKQQVSRKINLAPTGVQRTLPEAKANAGGAPPRDSVAEFQALMGKLREVAPPPKTPPPFAPIEPAPREYAPPSALAQPEPRKAAPPPPEPSTPPPLIVNAPDTPPPPPAVLSGKPLASEVLSARTPPMPPPASSMTGSPQKPPSAGFPAFSDLVIVAAKDGLDELEISRRYQLSVDQVRLILRMERNKTRS